MTERVRDPEMSAAAKRRAPPPNPWPELRTLRESNGFLQRRTKQLETVCDRFARTSAIKASIMDKQDQLDVELSPRFFRDTKRIAALRADIAGLYRRLNEEEGA